MFDNRTEVSTRDYRLQAKKHGIDSVDAMDHFLDLQALGRFYADFNGNISRLTPGSDTQPENEGHIAPAEEGLHDQESLSGDKQRFVEVAERIGLAGAKRILDQLISNS